MEWVTLYDIGAPHSVIWDDLLLVFVCLIVCGKLIFQISMVVTDKKNCSVKNIVRILFLCVILLLAFCSLVFGWVDWQIKGFNGYEKAYNEGNLEVVNGKAENIIWDRGAFWFTVADVNFICDIDNSMQREKNIEPYFNAGYELKVYYYGEEYSEEEKQEYAVLEDEYPYNMPYEPLRIDVLTDGMIAE